MGVFRLMLAVMVMLSHADVRVFGYNPGIVATVSFFLLSGFVMSALIEKYYRSFDRIVPFLIDRLARIGPQFYLYMALAILELHFYTPSFMPRMMFDAEGLILNASLVPLNFYVYLFPERMYIPQAWSLGLEVCFYLVVPFILLLRIRLPLAIASVGVFLAAFGGWLNTDQYGYRLLPGTLFMFLLGSYLYDAKDGRLPAWLPWAWGAAFAAHAASAVLPGLDLPYSKEVLMGLVVGLPAVWLLRHQPSGRVDAAAGNLSYGVFLNHNIVLFALVGLGISARDPRWLAAAVAVAVGLAWVSYAAVEAPLLRLRRAMRGRRSAPASAGRPTSATAAKARLVAATRNPARPARLGPAEDVALGSPARPG